MKFNYCLLGGRHSSMVLSAPTILRPGLNPKHTIYAFFNLYWNCNKKRTKINKKRQDWPIFLKTLVYHWQWLWLSWWSSCFQHQRSSMQVQLSANLILLANCQLYRTDEKKEREAGNSQFFEEKNASLYTNVTENKSISNGWRTRFFRKGYSPFVPSFVAICMYLINWLLAPPRQQQIFGIFSCCETTFVS